MANIEDTHYTETDTNSNNQVQNDINTEDSEPSNTWMQSILQAPETDSEDKQIMGTEPYETWEELIEDLERPSGIHLREEGIRNSLQGTITSSTGPNQLVIASLNQATIARGEIAWNKPYHSTSLAHFTDTAQATEYLCLMGQIMGTLPGYHRMGLLYQFYPDARDNTWTPQEGNYRSVLRALIQRRANMVAPQQPELDRTTFRHQG